MISAAQFEILREQVISALQQLDPRLYYHNIGHTLDVVKQSQRIAASEGITDEHQLMLLKIAALYHDTGFLHAYTGHEEESCALFLKDTQALPLDGAERKTITDLIMATKVSRNPSNHLEEILCDADLDYLGRDDFFPISNELKREYLYFEQVPSEEAWNGMQLNFLKTHAYYTKSSRILREPVKQEHYAGLLQLN